MALGTSLAADGKRRAARAAKEVLMTQAQLIEQFMDSTDAIVYLKDEEGRFLMVNRRAAEVLKKKKEELIGKKDRDFVPKQQADKFREMDQKVIQTHAPLNYRDTVTLPGGQFTIVDHKFPVSLEGHTHAVGGIAIELKEK
jgi:PAS domain S-box-containing protein